MNTIIFLDLEETLIDDWSSGILLLDKIAIIKEQIKRLPNPVIGLMSWAVWDHNCVANFNTRLRPVLEETLGTKFDDRFLWSMKDWAREVFHHRGKKITQEDLFDIFGKEEVLFMLSRCHPEFAGNTVILFDDAVEHGLHWSAANGCRVVIKNIDTLLSVWHTKPNN